MIAETQAIPQPRSSPTAPPAPWPRPLLILSILLIAAALTGCAQMGLPFGSMSAETASATQSDPAPALSPLFAFLASASAGEASTVEDPRTGATVRVTAGRMYHAASGRTCRRFSVDSPEGYDGMTQGLACKDDSGRWSKSQLLVNPDDLITPRKTLPGGGLRTSGERL